MKKLIKKQNKELRKLSLNKVQLIKVSEMKSINGGNGSNKNTDGQTVLEQTLFPTLGGNN